MHLTAFKFGLTAVILILFRFNFSLLFWTQQ